MLTQFHSELNKNSVTTRYTYSGNKKFLHISEIL